MRFEIPPRVPYRWKDFVDEYPHYSEVPLPECLLTGRGRMHSGPNNVELGGFTVDNFTEFSKEPYYVPTFGEYDLAAFPYGHVRFCFSSSFAYKAKMDFSNPRALFSEYTYPGILSYGRAIAHSILTESLRSRYLPSLGSLKRNRDINTLIQKELLPEINAHLQRAITIGGKRIQHRLDFEHVLTNIFAGSSRQGSVAEIFESVQDINILGKIGREINACTEVLHSFHSRVIFESDFDFSDLTPNQQRTLKYFYDSFDETFEGDPPRLFTRALSYAASIWAKQNRRKQMAKLEAALQRTDSVDEILLRGFSFCRVAAAKGYIEPKNATLYIQKLTDWREWIIVKGDAVVIEDPFNQGWKWTYEVHEDTDNHFRMTATISKYGEQEDAGLWFWSTDIPPLYDAGSIRLTKVQYDQLQDVRRNLLDYSDQLLKLNQRVSKNFQAVYCPWRPWPHSLHDDVMRGVLIELNYLHNLLEFAERDLNPYQFERIGSHYEYRNLESKIRSIRYIVKNFAKPSGVAGSSAKATKEAVKHYCQAHIKNVDYYLVQLQKEIRSVKATEKERYKDFVKSSSARR